MSHREKDRAAVSLDAVIKDIFKLQDEDVWRLSEAIADYARAIADDEIDRLFNRGDYRG